MVLILCGWNTMSEGRRGVRDKIGKVGQIRQDLRGLAKEFGCYSKCKGQMSQPAPLPRCIAAEDQWGPPLGHTLMYIVGGRPRPWPLCVGAGESIHVLTNLYYVSLLFQKSYSLLTLDFQPQRWELLVLYLCPWVRTLILINRNKLMEPWETYIYIHWTIFTKYLPHARCCAGL